MILLLLDAACSDSSQSSIVSLDAGGNVDAGADAAADAGAFGGPTSMGPSVAGTVRLRRR